MSNSTEGAADKIGTTKAPLSCLFLLYLEKFVEISLVFMLTLLAIKWGPLHTIMREQAVFWILLAFVVFTVVTLPIIYRFRWFRECPGFLIYKLLYLLFMSSVFLILAIHIPDQLSFVSPYFALVAAGTVAAFYLFFAFIVMTHKHFCKVPAAGCSLWLIIFAIPIGVLFVNQPVYFVDGVWQFQGYWDFMVNVTAGIVASLPFSYEALYIYRKFVHSKDLQDFLKARMLLPGFVTLCYSRRLENMLVTVDTLN